MHPLVKLSVRAVCCFVATSEPLFGKQHPCFGQLPGRRTGVKHHDVHVLSAQHNRSHSSALDTSCVGKLAPAIEWIEIPSSRRELHAEMAALTGAAAEPEG